MIILVILSMFSALFGFSLEQAIIEGLQQSIDLRQETEQNLFNEQQLRIAKQKFYPNYKLTASAGKTESSIRVWDKDAQIAPTIGLNTPYGTQLSASQAYSYYKDEIKPLTFAIKQPLLRGRSTIINTSSILDAQDNVEIGNINNKKTTHKTIIQIVDSYLKLNQAVIKGTMESIQYQEHLREMKSQQQKFEAGKISKEDLTSDQIQSDQLQLHAKQGEIEKVKALKAFKQLTGIQYHEKDTLKQPTLHWQIPDARYAIDQALSNNFDLMLDDFNIQKSNRKIIQSRDARLPDLSLNVVHKSDIHRRSYNTIKNEITVDLSYEFDFNAKTSDLDKAISDHKYSQLRHLEKVDTLAQDIQFQVEAIENLIEQVIISQSAVKHELELVKSNEINYQHGKKSLSDLHKSKHQLLKKQSELIKQESELIINQLNLADAMGLDLLPILLG